MRRKESLTIQTCQDLNGYIGQHFHSDKHNLASLIDEIQDIKEFRRSIPFIVQNPTQILSSQVAMLVC